MVFDIALVVIFIACFFVMSRRGFVKAVYNLFGHGITFILVAVMLTPMTQMFLKSDMGQEIYQNVSTAITNHFTGAVTGEITSGEEFYVSPTVQKSLIEEGVSEVAESTAPIITDMIMRILTAIIMFVLIRILIAVAFYILNIVFKLPLLSGVNRLAGGLVGILNAFIIVYLLCGIASLNFEWASGIREIIYKTTLVQYFYNNNILLNLFLGGI